MNMNVQGVSHAGTLNVREIKPGQLEALKKAVDNNDRDEIVIENEKGTFLLSAESLEIQHQYNNDEGQVFLTRPHYNSRDKRDHVVLGELKGKIVFENHETDPRSVVGGIGAFAGGVAGMAIGTQLMTDGSKLGDFVSFFLGGGPGALIGGLAGFAAGAGLTHLIAKPKPDAGVYEPFLKPLDATKSTIADSKKL